MFIDREHLCFITMHYDGERSTDSLPIITIIGIFVIFASPPRHFLRPRLWHFPVLALQRLHQIFEIVILQQPLRVGHLVGVMLFVELSQHFLRRFRCNTRECYRGHKYTQHAHNHLQTKCATYGLPLRTFLEKPPMMFLYFTCS